MTCEGHSAHDFETSDECRVRSHDMSERVDGFWDDNPPATKLDRESRTKLLATAASWTEAELREGFGR